MVWFSFTVHRLRIPHVPGPCSPGVPDNANSTGLCCARKHLTKGGYRYIVYNIDTPALDYTLRVKLNSLGSGVGISPLVALVSIELHSLRLGSRVGNS